MVAEALAKDTLIVAAALVLIAMISKKATTVAFLQL